MEEWQRRSRPPHGPPQMRPRGWKVEEGEEELEVSGSAVLLVPLLPLPLSCARGAGGGPGG